MVSAVTMSTSPTAISDSIDGFSADLGDLVHTQPSCQGNGDGVAGGWAWELQLGDWGIEKGTIRVQVTRYSNFQSIVVS